MLSKVIHKVSLFVPANQLKDTFSGEIEDPRPDDGALFGAPWKGSERMPSGPWIAEETSLAGLRHSHELARGL
jgi:hypothetical protein